jgi:hypothetical protein
MQRLITLTRHASGKAVVQLVRKLIRTHPMTHYRFDAIGRLRDRLVFVRRHDPCFAFDTSDIFRIGATNVAIKKSYVFIKSCISSDFFFFLIMCLLAQ